MSELLGAFAAGVLAGALATLFGLLMYLNITTRRTQAVAEKRDADAITSFHEKRPGARLKALDGGLVRTTTWRKP